MATMRRLVIAAATGALALTAPLPAAAQDTAEARLRKIEAEVRALQRKVFPDGAGKLFTPEIERGTATSTPVGTPATGPLTDVLARIDAVETQLSRLTAQAEENANRLGRLESRLAAMEPAAGTSPTPSTSAEPSSVTSNTTAMTGGASARPGAGQSATPPPERVAAVRAIEKPQSTDAGEDDYLYGFRLWEAKFYPEAQQQLQLTVDKHKRHKRLSYARNLLGRAYLDDGKPGTAAQILLQNYLDDKKGDRAPDSLLYLAVAMTRLKETQRACAALATLASEYPGEVAGRLSNQVASARAAVKCN